MDYSENGGSSYTTYYYLRNAQGDIVKLIDNGGDTKVEYTYDSWGKVLSTTGSLATSLGNAQPFRYRGYVYDGDTGWYYLQSRYYDPNTCRFISSDVLLSTGDGVLGHNSYAYCYNSPIMLFDSNGCTPANVIGAVIGAIGGAVIGNAIADYFNLKGLARWIAVGGTAGLLTVVGWFAGPAVYAAIRPIVIKAITACTVVFQKAHEWVLKALGIAQSYINQALRNVSYSTIRFTKKVIDHLNDPNRSVPVRHLIACIKDGIARPDPRGTNAIMYTITNFYRNGKCYSLEVLIDWTTRTILHFKYWGGK